jgi:hypothetical protein
MLGAEIDTFRGNKIVMGLLVVLALATSWFVYAAFTTPSTDNGFKIFALSLFAVPVLLFFWLKSIQVTLHTDGISYHSMFGEKEMPWNTVERFYYGATKQSVNFIPIGTYYHFKLVNSEGNKLRLGNRVGRLAVLGQKLIEYTFPTLLREAVSQYNSGQEVDFGAIRVSRTAGIKVKKFFGFKEIPWENVSSFAIQQGHFYVWRKGEKRTMGPTLRYVPNAWALQELLKSILSPDTAS